MCHSDRRQSDRDGRARRLPGGPPALAHCAELPGLGARDGQGIATVLRRTSIPVVECLTVFYTHSVIRDFRNKSLHAFFRDGDPRGIRGDLVERVRGRLQALHRAKSLGDLRFPGWRLHRLPTRPVRWAVAVNGPWRITFEWADDDAVMVDLEQYH
ncbi:MAG: hypothetical protein EXQ92_04615 [Alphaproteobacteria bacterium]|nr:hypothetical protein [Alphaproteobacteria bacterium]